MNDLLTPPPEREMPRDRLLLRQELLMKEFVRTRDRADEPAPAPTGRFIRSRRAVALVLVPAAFLAAGAAYALTRPSASQTVEAVVCELQPTPGSGGVVTGASGQDPTEVCREQWANGNVIAGSTEVPPLVACAAAEGHVILVFPSEDTALCERLGLPPVPEGYRHAAGQFAAMREDLFQRFGSDTRCVREDEAVQIARQVLDAHGYRDWKIEVGGGFDHPCASYAFDSVNKTLTMVGDRRPEGS